MTQNKVDKIAAGKVFEQLNNNEKKNIRFKRIKDFLEKLNFNGFTKEDLFILSIIKN